MRRVLALVAAAALAACDTPMAPNTDLGLRVWADAVPAVVSVRDSLAPIRLRVSVANPSDQPIRVRTGGPPYVSAPDPALTRGLWGSVRLAMPGNPFHAGPLADWWGDSVYVIPAHRTVYDERVVTAKSWRAAGWPLVVGTYTLRGWFIGREGASGRLQFVP